jgi:hypothetical protein
MVGACTFVKWETDSKITAESAGDSNITTIWKYYLAVRSQDTVLANKVTNKILPGVRSRWRKNDPNAVF